MITLSIDEKNERKVTCKKVCSGVYQIDTIIEGLDSQYVLLTEGEISRMYENIILERGRLLETQ